MWNNVVVGSDVSENKWWCKFLFFFFINVFVWVLIMGFDFSVYVLYFISMLGFGMYFWMSLLEFFMELLKLCRKMK